MASSRLWTAGPHFCAATDPVSLAMPGIRARTLVIARRVVSPGTPEVEHGFWSHGQGARPLITCAACSGMPKNLCRSPASGATHRSEEHTSELQSPYDLVC